jgi:hypothetical protein
VEHACHPAAPDAGCAPSFTKIEGRSVQSAIVRVTAVLLVGLELARLAEGAEGAVVSKVMLTVAAVAETFPAESLAQAFKA